MDAPVHTHAQDWIDQVFKARAVTTGGVLRRSVAWVEHEIGRDRFIGEVRRRGFHMLECGGQFVVVCSDSPIRMIC